MAALPAVVDGDAFEQLPEGVRDHYEPDGDVYRIRVEGYDDTKLKSALDKEREARKKLESQLKGVPDDFDRAELEELRKLRENLEDEKAKAAGDWEKLKERLEERHSKREQELMERADSLDQQLTQIVKRDAATAALANAGARVNALLPHVLDRIEVVEEDGARKAVAKGLDDEPTDISALVGQMKEANDEWGWGFMPNGAQGGGSAGSSNGAGRVGQVRSKADLGDPQKNPRAHVEFIKEHGLDKYRELPRGD